MPCSQVCTHTQTHRSRASSNSTLPAKEPLAGDRRRLLDAAIRQAVLVAIRPSRRTTRARVHGDEEYPLELAVEEEPVGAPE